MNEGHVVHYVTTYDEWKPLLSAPHSFVVVLLPDHHASIDSLLNSHTLETDIYVVVAPP